MPAEQQLQAGEKLDANFVNYFQDRPPEASAEVPRQLLFRKHPAAHRHSAGLDLGLLFHVGGRRVGAGRSAGDRAPGSPPTGRRNSSRSPFPGKPAIRLPAPTDTEIATYSNAKDGVWLSVLEKAFAIIRIKAEPAQASTKEPMDSGRLPDRQLESDGAAGPDHASKFVALPIASHHPADDRFVQQMRSGLQAALREHLVVESQKAAHDYAVVAYDTPTDTLTLHNPYGRGGFETWPDGGKGARTDEGFFTLTTTQWINYFVNVRFELGGRMS